MHLASAGAPPPPFRRGRYTALTQERQLSRHTLCHEITKTLKEIISQTDSYLVNLSSKTLAKTNVFEDKMTKNQSV